MEEKKNRKIYRQGYDPEYWTEQSLRIAETIPIEVAREWLANPCTQALIYSIQADVAGVVQSWLNGGYAEVDNVDSTAQMQAKGRGMAQACEDILHTINDIGYSKFTEEQ